MAMLLFLQVQADAASTDSGWGDYFQMLGALLVVLLLLFLAMRYVLPALPVARSAASGFIRVRATLPLEPRKRLYLVESGGKMLLLATTDHAVNLVGSFEPGDFPEAPPETTPSTKFSDLLKRGRR